MSEHEYPLDDSPESDAFRSGFAAGVAACREEITKQLKRSEAICDEPGRIDSRRKERHLARADLAKSLLSSLPGDRKEEKTDAAH